MSFFKDTANEFTVEEGRGAFAKGAAGIYKAGMLGCPS